MNQWYRIDIRSHFLPTKLRMFQQKSGPYTTKSQLIINFQHIFVISILTSIFLIDHISITRKRIFFEIPVLPSAVQEGRKFFSFFEIFYLFFSKFLFENQKLCLKLFLKFFIYFLSIYLYIYYNHKFHIPKNLPYPSTLNPKSRFVKPMRYKCLLPFIKSQGKSN